VILLRSSCRLLLAAAFREINQELEDSLADSAIRLYTCYRVNKTLGLSVKDNTYLHRLPSGLSECCETPKIVGVYVETANGYIVSVDVLTKCVDGDMGTLVRNGSMVSVAEGTRS
jgi:DNA transposition AAA+ family ATPase